jgi:YVTN family beta-propeller protein
MTQAPTSLLAGGKPVRPPLGVLPLALCLGLAACPVAADRDAPVSEPLQLDGLVFTADEEADSATRVDLATGHSLRVPLGISPHNIQISADGSMVLLVGPAVAEGDGGAHAHGAGGRLVILDPETMEESRSSIAAGEHPAHVVVDAENRFAYVTDSGANAVLVVDLEEGRTVRRIPTCAYPHGLRLSPDANELYVACVQEDAVAVIEVGSAAEVARIPVGRAPVQVAFTPDGAQVYVSLRDANAVAAVDTRARAVVRTVPVGRGPIQLFATPDGQFVYVANEGTRAQPDSTVSVIDVATGQRVLTVTTGAGAHGVVVSDDSRLVLISNLFDHTITVIDAADHRVVETFPVGRGPAGITYRAVRPLPRD